MSAVDEVRRWVHEGGPIGAATVRPAMRNLLAERDALVERLRLRSAALDRVVAERDEAVRYAEERRLIEQAITECREDSAGSIIRADRLAGEAIIRAHAAEARLARVEAIAFQSDDGTEYEHNGHGPNEGEPECPGCWAASIRAALAGESDG